MAITPADVGLRPGTGLSGCLDREDRARGFQGERLGHEIILAADPAHDLSVVETIGDDRAHQGRHHRVVDETRLDPRAPLGALIAIQLVRKRNRRHPDPRELARGHLAQGAIEGFRPEKKRSVQHDAIDFALEYAGLDQSQKCFGHHFAEAIEALLERPGLQRRNPLRSGRQPFHDGLKLVVVAMAHDQSLRQRIADLTDADLERAAVVHQCRCVETNGIFGIADRLRRRREQGKINRGTIENRAELFGPKVAIAGHERQFGVDLTHQFE